MWCVFLRVFLAFKVHHYKNEVFFLACYKIVLNRNSCGVFTERTSHMDHCKFDWQSVNIWLHLYNYGDCFSLIEGLSKAITIIFHVFVSQTRMTGLLYPMLCAFLLLALLSRLIVLGSMFTTVSHQRKMVLSHDQSNCLLFYENGLGIT